MDSLLYGGHVCLGLGFWTWDGSFRNSGEVTFRDPAIQNGREAYIDMDIGYNTGFRYGDFYSGGMLEIIT